MEKIRTQRGEKAKICAKCAYVEKGGLNLCKLYTNQPNFAIALNENPIFN